MCLACGGIGPGGDSVGEAVALWNCRSTLAASFGGRAPCEPPAAAERTDAPAAAEFVDGPRS